jgi:hypothetical protein
MAHVYEKYGHYTVRLSSYAAHRRLGAAAEHPKDSRVHTEQPGEDREQEARTHRCAQLAGQTDFVAHTTHEQTGLV